MHVYLSLWTLKLLLLLDNATNVIDLISEKPTYIETTTQEVYKTIKFNPGPRGKIIVKKNTYKYVQLLRFISQCLFEIIDCGQPLERRGTTHFVNAPEINPLNVS